MLLIKILFEKAIKTEYFNSLSDISLIGNYLGSHKNQGLFQLNERFLFCKSSILHIRDVP